MTDSFKIEILVEPRNEICGYAISVRLLTGDNSPVTTKINFTPSDLRHGWHEPLRRAIDEILCMTRAKLTNPNSQHVSAKNSPLRSY